MGKIRLLLEKATGKKYLVKDIQQDFHTAAGTIKSDDLQSKTGLVTSTSGKAFYLLEPAFPDLLEQLHRGPQIMLAKDVGFILAKTGVNRDSLVVDAGGGSGVLCLSLANVCKKVTVYENNSAHYQILMKNIGLLGLKNITVKQEDIYLRFTEREVDLITLDLPEPWRVTRLAEDALKAGGFLVVYAPQINQIKQFVDSTKETRMRVQGTIELLERRWKIEERIMRPEHEMLGHTGFLCWVRKLS